MTVYIDTSVLVAYYCPENLSEKAEVFLTAHMQPAISALTELELFSAISRKVQGKGMNHKDPGRVTAKFISHLNGHYFTYLPVEAHHFLLARDWIGTFKGLSLVTADKSLMKSAKRLGLSTILLE